MSRARFSIGIDLGTTNCAMAFVPLDGESSQSQMFPVPQWETLTALSESLTLPSFLYLPSESEAAQMLGREAGGREWISGRFARKRASESPGRVAHSAKSWLCHHAVDRSAPFLPWRSDEIPVEKRISPIQASALLLEYLRGAWDARFARDEAPFCHQVLGLGLHGKRVPLRVEISRLTPLDARRESDPPMFSEHPGGREQRPQGIP